MKPIPNPKVNNLFFAELNAGYEALHQDPVAWRELEAEREELDTFFAETIHEYDSDNGNPEATD